MGECLVVPNGFDEVSDILRPEHFFAGAHRIIFHVMCDLAGEGVTVEFSSVVARLRDREQIQRVGGAAYLGELIGDVRAVADVRPYAERVQALWQVRQTIAASRRIASEGYDAAEAPLAYLDEAEGLLWAATDREPANAGSVSVKEALVEAMTDLKRAADEGVTPGLLTSYAAVDKAMGGLHRTDLTIIAARPGMGKTAFGLGLGLRMARAKDDSGPGATVGVWSLEMSRKQVAMRVACDQGGVDVGRARTGALRAQGWADLTVAAGVVGKLPLEIFDVSTLTVQQLRSQARRLAAKAKRAGAPLVAVIVDYLQLMTAHGKQSREQEIANISRGMKQLAKELDVPVVALAQLSRAVEQRADKRPMLSDLRESGAIEQDADNVLFLYRPGYYLQQAGKDDDTDGVAELIISKQRNGPTGVKHLQFDARSASYRDRVVADYWSNGQ